MEALLQQAADGSSRGLPRWYAFYHAARCGRCGRFLDRMIETIGQLRASKKSATNDDAVKRLMSGKWREEAPKS